MGSRLPFDNFPRWGGVFSSPPPNLHLFLQARDCKMLGDVEGARKHSTRAKVLNIICSLLMVITVIVAIATFVAVIT